MSIDNLITDHIETWTTAQVQKKSGGRGRGKKADGQNQYGIKKLRELILELAVRGKLVPQDFNDEPASVLLEKIAEEKAQLVKKGKIKKQKPLPENGEDEKSSELPPGWDWARLQDISTYIQRGKGPKYAESGRTLVVSQKCIQWVGFDIKKARYVLDESLSTYQPERFLVDGDLLWNSTGTGTVGRINVYKHTLGSSVVADSHVTVIRSIHMNNNFLSCFISTPGIQLRMEPDHDNPLVSGTTNQVELNTSTISPILLPIPPLAEQHRIVAKVVELMALCDQLEQEQTDNSETHQLLVKTLLDTLTNATDHADFIESWQRIEANFDILFTTEASIDELKQTILQLAVMGKLVPQDPHDEPATTLLKKIAAEKVKLVKEGKIKKQKPLPQISADEKPFELPLGWEWVRFGVMATNSTAGWSPKCESFPREGDSWGVLKVSAVSWGMFMPNENKALPANLIARPEYEVKPGDFLISRANTNELVARSVVVPEKINIHLLLSDKTIRFTFSNEVSVNFINLANSSRLARDYYSHVAGGTSSSMKNVSREQIRNLVLAIPPLNEQHRIFTKLDELIGVCDSLTKRLNAAQTTQVQLADAIVGQAL